METGVPTAFGNVDAGILTETILVREDHIKHILDTSLHLIGQWKSSSLLLISGESRVASKPRRRRAGGDAAALADLGPQGSPAALARLVTSTNGK
jgi:hypothetical protein